MCSTAVSIPVPTPTSPSLSHTLSLSEGIKRYVIVHTLLLFLFLGVVPLKKLFKCGRSLPSPADLLVLTHSRPYLHDFMSYRTAVVPHTHPQQYRMCST